MMAKTAAERQREYRKNRPFASENGEQRLDLWVTTGVALELKRLANHHSLSQRAMLEQLVRAAGEAMRASLDDEQLDSYLLPGN